MIFATGRQNCDQSIDLSSFCHSLIRSFSCHHFSAQRMGIRVSLHRPRRPSNHQSRPESVRTNPVQLNLRTNSAPMGKTRCPQIISALKEPSNSGMLNRISHWRAFAMRSMHRRMDQATAPPRRHVILRARMFRECDSGVPLERIGGPIEI
jgi:hypothetical protein